MHLEYFRLQKQAILKKARAVQQLPLFNVIYIMLHLS